ncbi:unnamed protein product [Dibothriocephalus latus]|uniref:Uncharacterized protein n=1 Tax=Dibothriocephalus latus TaxID=60516 RepID=A0A3P7NGK2_DIBLA|nr:unnamed protein product [Dibothriocephalus latus]
MGHLREKALIVQLHQVTDSSQPHSSQRGGHAEYSDILQEFRVGDRVLSFQLQYSVEAAELEVIRFPGFVRAGGLFGRLFSFAKLPQISDLFATPETG